jgi:hypothetical protein
VTYRLGAGGPLGPKALIPIGFPSPAGKDDWLVQVAICREIRMFCVASLPSLAASRFWMGLPVLRVLKINRLEAHRPGASARSP